MGDNESHDSNGEQLADQWTSTPDLVGTVLSDRYKVLQPLGDGGMARVYLAEHIVLRKPIALKVLKNRFCHDQNNVERFLREARAASMIRHENVVDIIDFGQVPGGSVFIAMELLDGQDLDRLLEEERRMPWHRTRGIIIQVVRALKAAHSHGIIHRDMKPSNCYLVNRESGGDFVKVLDFGIAKVSGDSDVSLTETGAVFGTAKYMAPEQACGESVDARTDIYAVGIMMYEFLTGDVPFDGDSFMRVLTRHINETPIPPSQKAPDAGISPEAEAIVMQALSKHPDHRFQSMADLEYAIAQTEAHGDPSWPSHSESGPLTGVARNNPTRHPSGAYPADDPYAMPPPAVPSPSSRFTASPPSRPTSSPSSRLTAPPARVSPSGTSGFSRPQSLSPDSTIAISGMGGTELRSLQSRTHTTSTSGLSPAQTISQDNFSPDEGLSFGSDDEIDDWSLRAQRKKKFVWIIGGACGSFVLALIVAFTMMSPDSAESNNIAAVYRSTPPRPSIAPSVLPATQAKSPLVDQESILANDPNPPDDARETEGSADDGSIGGNDSSASNDHTRPPKFNSQPSKNSGRKSKGRKSNKGKKTSKKEKKETDKSANLPEPDTSSSSNKGTSSSANLDDLKKSKLSASDIKSGLANIRSQVKKCGSWATVKVQFTISPTGKVTSARAQRPFNQSDVGRCVEKLVKKARFPATSQKIMSIRVASFRL